MVALLLFLYHGSFMPRLMIWLWYCCFCYWFIPKNHKIFLMAVNGKRNHQLSLSHDLLMTFVTACPESYISDNQPAKRNLKKGFVVQRRPPLATEEAVSLEERSPIGVILEKVGTLAKVLFLM